MGTVYRVTASFLMPWGSISEWVWHYENTGGGSNLNQQIIDAIVTLLIAIWDLIKSRVDSAVVGQTLELAVFDPVLSEFNTIKTASISTLVGTAPNGGSPGNVAPYVSLFTSLARSRGKKFLFAPDKTLIVDGALTAPFVVDMLAMGIAFTTQIATSTSTYDAGNFNVALNRFLQWDNAIASVGVFSGSQYRRLPGRGT